MLPWERKSAAPKGSGAFADQGCAETLDLAGQDGLLDLGNCLGDLNAAGACFGAVEDGAATPHTFLVVEDFQAHVTGVVARIKDETVCVDNGGRAEVLAVGPEHWAG